MVAAGDGSFKTRTSSRISRTSATENRSRSSASVRLSVRRRWLATTDLQAVRWTLTKVTEFGRDLRHEWLDGRNQSVCRSSPYGDGFRALRLCKFLSPCSRYTFAQIVLWEDWPTTRYRNVDEAASRPCLEHKTGGPFDLFQTTF